jgi:hypothetical protein
MGAKSSKALKPASFQLSESDPPRRGSRVASEDSPIKTVATAKHALKKDSSATRAPDRLSALPDELLLPILSYLAVFDLSTITRTSKRIFNVAVDDMLWKPVVGALYHPTLAPPTSDKSRRGIGRLLIGAQSARPPAIPKDDIRNFIILLSKSKCLSCGVPTPDPGSALGRHVLRSRGQRFCLACQGLYFVPEATAATLFCLPPQLLISNKDLKPIKTKQGVYYQRSHLKRAAEWYYGSAEALEAAREKRKAAFQAAYGRLLEGGLMRSRGGAIVMR